METLYESRIIHRNTLHFMLGVLARVRNYFKYKHSEAKARKKGAKLGQCVTLSPDFAYRLNPLATIGNHTSIAHDCNLSSLREPLTIGSHVIIGNDVKLIRGSHNIDSPQYERITSSREGLIIEDYVWICPHTIILPSVRRIGRGAVIGAGSVVAKDVEPMAVVAGNPAKLLRYRKCVHSNCVVESLLGNDLDIYIKTWIKARRNGNNAQ